MVHPLLTGDLFCVRYYVMFLVCFCVVLSCIVFVPKHLKPKNLKTVFKNLGFYNPGYCACHDVP